MTETAEAPELTEEERAEEAAGWDIAEARYAPSSATGREQDQEPETAEAADEADGQETSQEPQEESPDVQEDPWAGLTEEQISRARQLEQQFRSEQARSVAQRRRADQLQAELEQLKQQRPAAQEQKAPELPEALVDAFPEVADLLRYQQEQLAALKQHIDTRVTPVEEMTRQNVLLSNEDALAQAHPDWRQIIADPRFSEVVLNAPSPVRNAAEMNGQGIVDPEAAAFVLDWYKGNSGGAAVDTQNRNGVSSIKDARTRKLAAAETARIKDDVQSKPFVEADEDELARAGWEYADKKLGSMDVLR